MPEAVEARLTFGQLQAIASPSRFRILRALHERRGTISEISKASDVAKSTTHASLELLECEGLVRRVEDERVWVYYELTPVGRVLARSNPLRLVVYLAIALLLGMIGGGVLVWDYMLVEDPWYLPPIGVPPELPPPFYEDPLVWGLTFVALALAFAVLAWRRWRRPGGSVA